MPALKLPGGTCLLIPALLFFPARNQILLSAALIAKKEKDLSFNMGGDSPASLLVTMDCFNGYPKEISKLLLRSAKFFPCGNKLIFVHNISSFQT